MIFRKNRGFNVKSAMFARLIWRAQKNAVDESCNHFSDINCAAVCTTVPYTPMPNLINYFFGYKKVPPVVLKTRLRQTKNATV